jgi:hypothetical protein
MHQFCWSKIPFSNKLLFDNLSLSISVFFMKQLYLLILVNLCLAAQNPLFSQVSGYVHRHSSSPLSKDRPKGGFTKVGVRAYDAQGKFLTSATSDATGYYQLDVPAGQRVRLEFDQLPQGFSPAPGQSRTYGSLVNLSVAILVPSSRSTRRAIQKRRENRMLLW